MSMEQEVVRIGWQFSKGLLDTLSTFVTSYKYYAGTKADRSIKSYQKELAGKKFVQRDKFVAQAMFKAGKVEFEQLKLHEKDLKKFDKLCRVYGVDFLYEMKPDGLDINKIISTPEKNRNSFEKTIIKNWTEVNTDGILIETPDNAKITFRMQDINKMEFVIEDMLNKKRSLEVRKQHAKKVSQKVKKTINKIKTKERN